MIYADTFRALSERIESLAAKAMAAQGFYCWVATSDAARAATSLASLRDMQAKGTLYVWSGCSDNTIWGTARRNMLARVWHDCVHLELGADFNYHDEHAVASHQTYSTPGLTPLERGAVWADTFGMLSYEEKNGRFPEHQADFVRGYMSNCYRL